MAEVNSIFLHYDQEGNLGPVFSTYEAAHESVGAHLRPKASYTHHLKPYERSLYQEGDLVHDFGTGKIVERAVR